MKGVVAVMFCRITELHNKEVINVGDGCRLGCVDDVEVDTCTAKLTAIVIRGQKFLGIFGKAEDIVIPWEQIEVVGDETVLVNFCPPQSCQTRRKCTVLGGLFG